MSPRRIRKKCERRFVRRSLQKTLTTIQCLREKANNPSLLETQYTPKQSHDLLEDEREKLADLTTFRRIRGPLRGQKKPRVLVRRGKWRKKHIAGSQALRGRREKSIALVILGLPKKGVSTPSERKNTI